MNSLPLTRRRDIVVSETHDETIVYDLKTNKVFCLNDTCRRVWNLCDGTRTPERIGIDIDGKETGKEMAKIALMQLERSGLMEPNGFESPRTSRREMIRILGVAGAMSLPLITALVAPSSAYAQSVSCPPPQTPCPGDILIGRCCTPPDVCCGGASCCGNVAQCCGPSCCEVGEVCCGGTTCCIFGEVCTGGVCVPA